MYSTRETVLEAFPAVESIGDDDLREAVVDAWTTSLEETGHHLPSVQWLPPVQADLGLPEERLVPHVNDVVEGAVALGRLLVERRGADVSMDVVRAGALVHDLSKLYEFDADGGETPLYDLLDHPHYGIHPAARAGLPPAVLHIVLSHTDRTAVDPATLEAVLVRRADEVAGAAIRDEAPAGLEG